MTNLENHTPDHTGTVSSKKVLDTGTDITKQEEILSMAELMEKNKNLKVNKEGRSRPGSRDE